MASMKSPVGRVAFPQLFEPKGFEDSEPRFSVTLLFDENETDLTEMKMAATAAAEDRWKENIPGSMKSPFRSGTEFNDRREGDGKDRLDGFDGMTFIRFTSRIKPGVFDQGTQEIEAGDTRVYGGNYGIVMCSPFAYDMPGSKGVSFGFTGFQLVSAGEPFGVAPAKSSDFEPVVTDAFGSDDSEDNMFA